MHELSLCNAIAATVTEHAAGRPIRSVRLQIGAFRQVVPDTLRFCWSARIANTVLAVGSVGHRIMDGDLVCGIGAKTPEIPPATRVRAQVWALRGPLAHN